MTGQEIEEAPRREIAVPGVGSLIDLDEPAQVAMALRDVKQFASALSAARAVLEEAMVDEAMRQGTKTLRFGERTVKIGSDSELEWNLKALEGLIEAGLPQDRYDELVTVTLTYKVSSAVANQIAGANPRYRRIIEDAKGRRPKKISVGVE